ncbi:MAG TPA: GTPase [Phycisphaerales bacterium]|nr:GTPase [Phycisphaerales bacterium]
MLAAGFVEANQATTDTSDEYPEAKDHYEACMLGALARAASPLAVDALLRQPEIWRSSTPSSGERLRPRARVMNRLLSPPMVVAVGAANVGKSSLVNALARRMVSITADEPGTTRDHVGVLLELAGLVVRWIDMPGVRTGADAADPIELEASELAREVALSADLVVICGDHRSGFLDAEMIGLRRGQLVIRCATRADLSESTSSDADVITSATTGAGLTELALAIRRVLVPDEQLEINEPWLFDERLLDNPR